MAPATHARQDFVSVAAKGVHAAGNVANGARTAARLRFCGAVHVRLSACDEASAELQPALTGAKRVNLRRAGAADLRRAVPDHAQHPHHAERAEDRTLPVRLPRNHDRGLLERDVGVGDDYGLPGRVSGLTLSI